MDKLTILYSQLLILGAIICVTTSVSLRHKRNVIAEYHWPEPNPEIDQFPHETTCHYYYLVLSEDDITVNKCPDGQLFDYIDHKCSRKENARCWSRHFGKMKHHHMKLKSIGHFRCPYAWGKYPDIKNCTMYYVCLSGKVKHKKCAPFENFDKVSRKCVAAIDAVCADETDIGDPDYKCPRTWGSFAFSDDCSKYYECLQKRPSLRTCPTGTLFHEIMEECLPRKYVHCDSRHNPYRKKEETTKSNKSENSRVTSSKTTISVKEKKPESENEIISETKISTPDPNSIIIEIKPSISDYSPSFENLSTVNKVPHSESYLVTSRKTTIPDKEKKPDSENKIISETKVNTPDPNSIIIEKRPSIPDYSPSFENLSTVDKVPHSESDLVTSRKTTIPDKEKKPESENKIISETKVSTPDPNSIIIEKRPSIPDHSPSFENLSTVDKVTNSESNLVTSSESIVTSKEIIPKSENKITSETKMSTNDPNSIIIETMLVGSTESQTNQTTEELPSKEPDNLNSLISNDTVKKETKDLPEKQSVSNKVSTDFSVKQSVTIEKPKDLPAKPTVYSEESTVLPAKQNVTNLEAKDSPSKKIVSNEESKNLSPKQSVSNETESSVKISEETISVNDTNEVKDVDSGITDEFIEISTSEAKSSSLLATQTIIDDSTQNPKKEIVEVKDEQTTAKPKRPTPMDECSPKDPTCINGERGLIIRCPGEDGLYPYPEDERRFLVCEKSNIRVRFCTGVTIFNDGKKKCVARLIFS